MTFFPIRLWKPCMRIMEKLWGFSFRSNQANSPVRATNSIIFLNHQRAVITGSELVWQGPRTLATYRTSSLGSILSSPSAQTRWITRRSTPRQQVGSLGLDGIVSNDSVQICAMLICFLSFVLFFFSYFFFACQDLKRLSCSPWGQPKP